MSSDDPLKSEVETPTQETETAPQPEDTPAESTTTDSAMSPPDSAPAPPTETVAETPAEPTTPPVAETPAEPATPEPVAETPAPTTETPKSEAPATPAPVAETPVETPAPVVPENPPSSEAPAPSEPVTTSEVGETSEPAKTRPQLNPTVDPTGVKPVSSFEATNTDPTPADNGEAKAPPKPEPIPPSMPAEIPKSQDLDADLEAQIAAAQASDDAAGSQPVPAPQAAETPTEDGAEATPAAAGPTSEDELEPGTRLSGKVQSIAGDDVFFDVGFRSPALISIRQFESGKTPEVGQTYQIVVDKVNSEEGLINASLPRGKRKIQGNWDAVEAGQVVDCMVTKTNKGGLEITISNLRGFLPASQVEMGYVSDLEQYVGQKLTVKITEANRAKRNLIVSRRAYLQEEREAKAEEIWAALEVGQAKQGVVKTIKDYGAFVDIGGVDGFLHIGEISWTRIRHPKDAISEGQQIDVQILSVDQDRKRIGLGMRQLVQNPWDTATQKYAQGTTVSGRVTRTTDFGAFIELEAGVEGLVHISELEYRRVNKVTDVLNVGDEKEFQVLDLDLGRKRISLSLKALQEKPADLKPEKKSDEDMAPGGGEQYTRKRKGPLKGGTGGSDGGGLFGNPGDFS